MKKSSQACKISRISGETLKSNYFAIIHWQSGIQPQKIIRIIIYLSIKIKKDVKLTIL